MAGGRFYARVALGVVVVALAATFAVTRARTSVRPSPAPADAGVEALAGVRLSGCATISRDGTCALAPGTSLRIWVPAPADATSLEVDGHVLVPTAVRAVREGTLLTVGAPEGDHALTVTVAGRSFRGRLAAVRPKPASVQKAAELRDAGDLPGARALLEGDRARAEAAGELAPVVAMLGRLALAAGEEDAADALLERSMALSEAAGVPSDAADDGYTRVFALVSHARYAEANRVLERAVSLSARYPDGRARAMYYRAWLSLLMGSTRAALSGFREAVAETERLGLARLGRMASQLEATTLDEMGRPADALALLESVSARGEGQIQPCDLADLYSMMGMIGARSDAAVLARSRERLKEAMAIHKTTCKAPYDPARLANVLGLLARIELQLGDRTAAEAHLREAEAAAVHPRVGVLLSQRALRAELAAARGDHVAAVAAWSSVDKTAREVNDGTWQIVALEGKAEGLAHLGQVEGAIAALDESRVLVDRGTVSIPLGEGREGYVGGHQREEVRRVELLVKLGHLTQAAEATRDINARTLDTLANADRLATLDHDAASAWSVAVGSYRKERDEIEREAGGDWALPKDTLAGTVERRARRAARAQGALDEAIALALGQRSSSRATSPPRPGDVQLALVPGDHGWTGLVTEGGTTRAVALGTIDPAASPDALAAALLVPFRSELSRGKRLEVVALGDARKVDIHVLPWEGAPLVARLPVVYPEGRGAPPPTDAAPGTMLVVGDPTSDLPFARREVDDVTAQFRAAGDARLTVLTGAAATGSAVRAALGGAGLFHYAGHGKFAGRDGWQSALPLADHTELTVADILALPRAPDSVVLLGCETARTSGEARAEGLGIAQAFLVAGTSAVIASTRTVDDAASSAIATALYARVRPGADLAAALGAAQVDAWKKGVADYGAFRVLVR